MGSVGEEVKKGVQHIGKQVSQGAEQLGNNIGVKDLGNLGQDAANYLTLGGYGTVKGAVNELFPKGDQAPPPGIDPNLAAAQQAMANQANDFTANMGGYEKQLGGEAESQGRRRMAERMGGVEQNASRRGLLYSGIKQANLGQVQGEEASNVAEKKRGIRVALGEEQQSMQDRAIKAGVGVQQLAQQQADAAYSQAMDRVKGRASGIGSLAQGAGGMLAGVL